MRDDGARRGLEVLHGEVHHTAVHSDQATLDRVALAGQHLRLPENIYLTRYWSINDDLFNENTSLIREPSIKADLYNFLLI